MSPPSIISTPSRRFYKEGQLRNGLLELFKGLKNSDEEERAFLTDAISRDLGKVMIQFHGWWEEKSKTNKWESATNGTWEIDFDTCEIFLNKS